MSLIPFNELPDIARLWIFNTDRDPSPEQIMMIHAGMERFLQQWTAHSADVTAGYELRYDRFILVGVDEAVTAPSGCSIDTLVNFLKELQKLVGLQIVDAPDVCFRDELGVKCVTRARFDELAQKSEVTAATTVFDNTLSRLGDLRSGNWERQARDAWHARAFELKEEVA
jgi:hypothetical protein